MRFYSAVLETPCEKQEMPGMTFAVMSHPDKDDVSGCLTP